jgi:predicted glycogen debranching enzyme
MDAKVGDFVVTPRRGCPVEINALWYNALRVYIDFQKICNDQEGDWNLLAEKVRLSFRRWFINKKGYLNDVVIPEEYVDDAFRPNQLYALSLPFLLLDEEESEILLGQIRDKLFTPYGLRSLAMDHPGFVPVYSGDQWHRDSAYHQGTVWVYLIGEYFLAYLKLHKHSDLAKKEVLGMMSALKEHFYHDDCIHGISEIFDGAMPGPGRGCIHQAWSVAMLLLVFDALSNNP